MMTDDKAEQLARDYHRILTEFAFALMKHGHRLDHIAQAMLIFGAEAARDTTGISNTLKLIYEVEAALTKP